MSAKTSLGLASAMEHSATVVYLEENLCPC